MPMIAVRSSVVTHSGDGTAVWAARRLASTQNLGLKTFGFCGRPDFR